MLQKCSSDCQRITHSATNGDTDVATNAIPPLSSPRISVTILTRKSPETLPPRCMYTLFWSNRYVTCGVCSPSKLQWVHSRTCCMDESLCPQHENVTLMRLAIIHTLHLFMKRAILLASACSCLLQIGIRHVYRGPHAYTLYVAEGRSRLATSTWIKKPHDLAFIVWRTNSNPDNVVLPFILRFPTLS